MRVWVIMGGMSPEREVSLDSGCAVARALGERGHQVWAYELRDGIFLHELCTADALLPEIEDPDAPGRENPATSPDRTREPAGRWAARLLQTAQALRVQKAEVAFLALHGEEGEDGRVQALLEIARFPYTGSGPATSALAMDKTLSKRVMEALGIRTPAWTLLRVPGAAQATPGTAGRSEGLPPISALAESPVGGLPAVVKPNAQGSSVGISIVREAGEWEAALRDAAEWSRNDEHGNARVLVESFIPGRELTVGLLDGKPLPVVEIRPRRGFYDYERKYTPGETEYDVPADLEPESASALQAQALQLYEALGCRGVARVDFRRSTEGEDYCLELNTIPGLTSTSLIPKAAAAIGLTFPELLEAVCAAAAGAG